MNITLATCAWISLDGLFAGEQRTLLARGLIFALDRVRQLETIEATYRTSGPAVAPMDLIKLLKSVDDFIYEIALWVLFVPRTFFKILFRPRWVCTYVEAELQKDKQARFQEYLSPILYWALVGLVPYFFVLGALSSVTESRVASEVGFRRLLALDWQNQLLVVSLFAVGGPSNSHAVLSVHKLWWPAGNYSGSLSPRNAIVLEQPACCFYRG